MSGPLMVLHQADHELRAGGRGTGGDRCCGGGRGGGYLNAQPHRAAQHSPIRYSLRIQSFPVKPEALHRVLKTPNTEFSPNYFLSSVAILF